MDATVGALLNVERLAWHTELQLAAHAPEVKTKQTKSFFSKRPSLADPF